MKSEWVSEITEKRNYDQMIVSNEKNQQQIREEWIVNSNGNKLIPVMVYK